MKNINKSMWEKNRGFLALITAVVLILLIGSGPLAVQWNIILIGDRLKPMPLQWRWISIVIVMAGYLAFVGKWKTVRQYEDDRGYKAKTSGRFDGVFIDSRNKISLSQFQIILWTLLALSAWSALVLHRVTPIISHNVQELRIQVVEQMGKEANKDKKVESVLLEILGTKVKGLDDIKLKSLFTLLTGDEKLPESSDSISNYDPLNVSFPSELLLAMGISTASLAGAAIIKTNKSRTESGRSLELYKNDAENARSKLEAAKEKLQNVDKEIDNTDSQVQSTKISDTTKEDLRSRLRSLEAERELINKSVTDAQQKYDELVKAEKERSGLIHVNENVEDADWSDLLSGEKIHDYQLMDLAKVQMFYFTLIIVFSYAVLLWAQMGTFGAADLLEILPNVSLPAFSDSLVTLLAISHVGYLSVKNTG